MSFANYNMQLHYLHFESEFQRCLVYVESKKLHDQTVSVFRSEQQNSHPPLFIGKLSNPVISENTRENRSRTEFRSIAVSRSDQSTTQPHLQYVLSSGLRQSGVQKKHMRAWFRHTIHLDSFPTSCFVRRPINRDVTRKNYNYFICRITRKRNKQQSDNDLFVYPFIVIDNVKSAPCDIANVNVGKCKP